jgi:hypothetical protein
MYTQKIRTRYEAAPAQSATLEQLVENEKGEKKRTATEGLLWLLRCVLLSKPLEFLTQTLVCDSC